MHVGVTGLNPACGILVDVWVKKCILVSFQIFRKEENEDKYNWVNYIPINVSNNYQQRRQNSSTYNFMLCILSSTCWLHAFLPLYNRYMGAFLATKSIYKSPGACRSAHTASDRTL
jgi:hypothetical protein